MYQASTCQGFLNSLTQSGEGYDPFLEQWIKYIELGWDKKPNYIENIMKTLKNKLWFSNVCAGLATTIVR